MPDAQQNAPLWALATAVRDAAYASACDAYANARTDGLCHEGAQEIAVHTLRDFDYAALIARLQAGA